MRRLKGWLAEALRQDAARGESRWLLLGYTAAAIVPLALAYDACTGAACCAASATGYGRGRVGRNRDSPAFPPRSPFASTTAVAAANATARMYSPVVLPDAPAAASSTAFSASVNRKAMKCLRRAASGLALDIDSPSYSPPLA